MHESVSLLGSYTTLSISKYINSNLHEYVMKWLFEVTEILTCHSRKSTGGTKNIKG